MPLIGAADQALIQSELADPALVGQLLSILQNPEEYRVYSSAVEVPRLAAQLSQGAQAAGPKGAAAVRADLAIVATQRRQEAEISAAEARLRRLGFGDVQRRALQPRDAFIAPVGGPLGQAFGPTAFALEPPLGYQGVFYPHFHTGIDIDAALETPVQAAMAGVVALVATSRGGYRQLHRDRAWLRLLDAPCPPRQGARRGRRDGVPGQVVGLVGTTGNSTGPHLPFEIRLDGGLRDPLPDLRGAIKPW